MVIVISRWETKRKRNESSSFHLEISADESNEIVIVFLLRSGRARSRRVFANPAGKTRKSRAWQTSSCVVFGPVKNQSASSLAVFYPEIQPTSRDTRFGSLWIHLLVVAQNLSAIVRSSRPSFLSFPSPFSLSLSLSFFFFFFFFECHR